MYILDRLLIGDELGGVPAHDHEEEMMDEQMRQERALDALKSIAARLERLLLLREYELGVRVVNDEGSLGVQPVEREA